MQQSEKTCVVPFDGNPMLDEIQCGHCEGSSLWKWEIGFIFVMRADPPPAPECEFGDGEFITAIISEARKALAERAG